MNDSFQLLPNYLEFSIVLEEIQMRMPASEVHGIVCGYLCGQSANNLIPLWRLLSLNKKKAYRVFDKLVQICEISQALLTEFSFDFKLMLPDDDEGLKNRAEALGLWCQGFLIGLNQREISLREQLTQEGEEALKDITEIAKINFDEVSDHEEDEQAYYELIEHVRLSTIIIFQELSSGLRKSSENC